VEALGGAARAIEKGFVQEAIAASAWELQQAQESGEMVVVGVNKFTDEAEMTAIAAPDFAGLAARQRESLTAARARRDPARVAGALEALRAAADASGEIMPAIVDAVRARATLGEISDRLRDAWGVYRG
jgi:methylmalonyl-CoA mutase N-terminal domain/subunit